MEASQQFGPVLTSRIRDIQTEIDEVLACLTNRERQTLCKIIAAHCLREVTTTEPLGPELHTAISPFLCNIAFEGVLFRHSEGRVEVFLSRRPADDSVPAWRNKLHVPGVLLYSWEMAQLDTDVTTAAKRLSDKEYGGLINGWVLVGDKMFQAKRGPARCLIHLISVSDDPAKYNLGDWYDVHNLPSDVISAHCDAILPVAVKAFLEGR